MRIVYDEIETIDVGDESPQSCRRGFERYALHNKNVRAKITTAQGDSYSGRLTETSVTGFWVQTDSPLPFKAPVELEWSVDGYSMSFIGRVVRRAHNGMAIHIQCDDSSWQFRSKFVTLARAKGVNDASVVVRCMSVEHGEEHQALLEAWQKTQGTDDDRVHQLFISEMLKRRRLDYALERYRQLLDDDPNHEFAPKYLKQIGTILSFYTLQRAPQGTEEQNNHLRKPFILLVLGIALLLAGGWVVNKQIPSGRAGPAAGVHQQP